MRRLARQRMITVEVTVAASSSYVGVSGVVRPRAAQRRDAGGPAPALGRARCSRRSAPEAASRRRSRPAVARVALAFPAVRTARDVARLAEEVFALPGRIAAARSRRVAIALDEFQAIAAFDGGNVEHALRAAVQDQRSVGYVFAGSEPSLMERMLDAAPAVLQSRPGRCASRRSTPRIRRVHRNAIRAQRHEPEPGLGDGHRRTRRQRALRRAAAGARDVGRRAGGGPARRRAWRTCTRR